MTYLVFLSIFFGIERNKIYVHSKQCLQLALAINNGGAPLLCQMIYELQLLLSKDIILYKGGPFIQLPNKLLVQVYDLFLLCPLLTYL